MIQTLWCRKFQDRFADLLFLKSRSPAQKSYKGFPESKVQILGLLCNGCKFIVEVNCRYVSESYAFSLGINAIPLVNAIIFCSMADLKNSHRVIHFRLYLLQYCCDKAASSCDVCLRATYLSSDLTKIEGIIKGVFQCYTVHVHLLTQQQIRILKPA